MECEVNAFDGFEDGTTRRDALTINSAPVITDVQVLSRTDEDGDGDPTTAVFETP